MKPANIIQTLWTGSQNLKTDAFGWYKPYYHLMSWALSSELLAKNSSIDLYTNDHGYEILVNQLGLPYKNVYPIESNFDFGPDLWAVSKIETYRKQRNPFIHIDGDVFAWENITQLSKNENSIFVQNIEKGTVWHAPILDKLERLGFKLPPFMENCYSDKDLYALNLGVFGSRNIPFTQEYTEQAIDFLRMNASLLKEVNGLDLNIIFEQMLLYYLVVEKEVEIECLLDEIYGDSEYIGFGDFHQVPHSKKYLHLLGTYKKELNKCKDMEHVLLNSFPPTHEKIERLFYNDPDYRINKIFPSTFYFSSKVGVKVDIEQTISVSPNTYFSELCTKLHNLELEIFTEFHLGSEDIAIKNNIVPNDLFENSHSFNITKNEGLVLKKVNYDSLQNDSVMREAIEVFIKCTINDIAIIPTNHPPYYKYFFVDEVDLKILSLLDAELKLDQLINTIKKKFDSSAEEHQIAIFIKDKVSTLLFRNLIYINHD